MKTPQGRKKSRVTLAAIDNCPREELELAAAEPDSLRDSVREALLQLSEEKHREVKSGLLSAITRAGVNIGHRLLLLGIPARTAEELTAPEMGILIRYLRISEPGAMAAVAPILLDILPRQSEATKGVRPSARPSKRAA